MPGQRTRVFTVTPATAALASRRAEAVLADGDISHVPSPRGAGHASTDSLHTNTPRQQKQRWSCTLERQQ